MKNDLFILTLLLIPKISNKIVLYIIKTEERAMLKIEDIEEILIRARKHNTRIPKVDIDVISTAKERAKKILKKSFDLEIKTITILDDDFPQKLKEISNPPVILYYKGNKQCLLENKNIAVIGTRNPTSKGIEIAEKLGSEFGSEGFIIVSGLAKGCDEIGQKACVEQKGKTIAVLPCGLDRIYPASNKKLAEQILSENGCLISEYPIETGIFKSNFIERDRLQSALSEVVFVVETDEIGGTMHTVGYALEQNKVLACYKHNDNLLSLKQSRGNQKLIKEGKAIGIHSTKGIALLKKILNEKTYNETDQEFFMIQTRLL